MRNAATLNGLTGLSFTFALHTVSSYVALKKEVNRFNKSKTIFKLKLFSFSTKVSNYCTPKSVKLGFYFKSKLMLNFFFISTQPQSLMGRTYSKVHRCFNLKLPPSQSPALVSARVRPPQVVNNLRQIAVFHFVQEKIGPVVEVWILLCENLTAVPVQEGDVTS